MVYKNKFLYFKKYEGLLLAWEYDNPRRAELLKQATELHAANKLWDPSTMNAKEVNFIFFNVFNWKLFQVPQNLNMSVPLSGIDVAVLDPAVVVAVVAEFESETLFTDIIADVDDAPGTSFLLLLNIISSVTRCSTPVLFYLQYQVKSWMLHCWPIPCWPQQSQSLILLRKLPFFLPLF